MGKIRIDGTDFFLTGWQVQLVMAIRKDADRKALAQQLCRIGW